MRVWLPMFLAVILGLPGRTSSADQQPLKRGEPIIFLGDSLTAAATAPTGHVSLIESALADARLDAYAEISRTVARGTGAELCDLRKAFQEYLTKNNVHDPKQGVLTLDRVHLSDAGNRLVAETILAVIAK